MRERFSLYLTILRVGLAIHYNAIVVGVMLDSSIVGTGERISTAHIMIR
jgi:hypothetical protein